MDKYLQLRESLYGPLRQEGIFTWDRMYGEEYALASFHLISQGFREELSRATKALYQIYSRVVEVLRAGEEELLVGLGLPPETWRAVRIHLPTLPLTGIGRFDFVRTSEGLKMLEFNSDTPTGIVEAFYVNEKACRFFGTRNPNKGMEEHIPQVFREMVSAYQHEGYSTEGIYFSSLDWHEEDAGTTHYLLNQSGLPGRFVPLKHLRMDGQRVYALIHDQLEPVDLLYRLHALEILAGEKDADGFPSGATLLQLVANKKVAFINPPSAFLAQSKGIQALIWSLHENGEFFTPEEHGLIEKYALPTYFENPFPGRKESYVEKPIFGREGGGVLLYSSDGELLSQDPERQYGTQPVVYQKAVALEEIQVETLNGLYDGHLLWGSFVIGGKPSALVARVGGPITNNGAYYLPVGLKGDGINC